MPSGGPRERRNRRAELTEADESPLERDAEPARRRFGARRQFGIVRLREVDEAAVVAEVEREQLRVPVEAEASDYEPVEVPNEEVRQVEGPGLVVGELREGRTAGIHLIAVGALEPPDALGLEHPIEEAAGAAVGIGHEDPVVAVGACSANPRCYGSGDAFGPVVKRCRKARQVDGGQAGSSR